MPPADAPGCKRRHADRQQEAGGDLRVEGLRRRNAHLDVAAVRGVEHAVGLVDEIAAPTVHDRQHDGAAAAGEVNGPIGVGGRAGLADRHHQRRRHVVVEAEAREFGGRRFGDLDVSPFQRPGEGGGDCLTCHGRGALTDDDDAIECPVGNSAFAPTSDSVSLLSFTSS